jgi:hypothetical protein
MFSKRQRLGKLTVTRGQELSSTIWRAPTPEFRRLRGKPLAARLHGARQTYGAIVDRRMRAIFSRADERLCLKFLQQAGLDSGDESLYWSQLLALGARPAWYSLAKSGFDHLRAVDPETLKTLDSVRRPCLQLNLRRQLLLFPQVTLDARKGYYRLDALVCVLVSGRRVWLDLEIDGSGHRGEFDERREKALGLPTLRLTPAEIGSENLLEILEGKLLALLPEEDEQAA